MSDASSLGITPASSVQTSLNLVYNSVFPSKDTASFIGGLSADNTDLNVLSQLTPQVSSDWYTFNFEKGSNLKLSFNGIVGAFGDSNNDAPGSTTDATNLNLRYQLYDISGNLVADSDGTDDQKAAYADLTSSTGLAASNGGYYVQVSASPGTTISSLQSYSFQLYSGSTYATNLVTTAQTQAYDPNLFVSASSTVSASTNLSLYTNSANLSGTSSQALAVGTLNADASEVDVVSQLNEQNQAAYYKFNFQSGSSLKFTLNNTTTDTLQAQPLRVQLYDSTGQNLLADNYGTTSQKQAYAKLASGEGLAAANGNYIAKVSYAPNSNVGAPQTFNFQFNSGSSYDTVYKTTTSIPTTTSTGATPNLGVFTNSQAQLYTRSGFHTIGETAASAVNIGWIQQDKSQLDVVSQLTTGDNSDFYSFTLQQGNNLKLAFQNSTNTAATRIKILDSSGTQVIADNYGTDAQKAAYQKITTDGVAASPGQYLINVSYAPGASQKNTQTYNLQIYSGNTYINSYKTTVSAQTYQNAILSGNTAVTGTANTNMAIATYLNNLFNGDDNPSIFDTLSTTV